MSSQLFFEVFAARHPDEVVTSLRQLDTAGWQNLVEVAQRHRCAPMLRERLKEWGALDSAPEPARERLARIERRNAVRNLKRFGHLHQLAATLGTETPLIVLKGGRLAQTHYRRISLRGMSDLDVLARPEQVSTGIRQMTALGYVQAQKYEFHHYQEERKDLQFEKDGELVELHRSLLDAGEPFTIDQDGIWQRAIATETPGLFYLSVEDQLVHLCLHGAYHHRMSIGLYAFVDIGLMCQDETLDWLALIERARAWKAQRCVFLSLKLAERLVAAPIPERVLAELQPCGFNQQILNDALRAIHGLMDGDQSARRFANTLAWFTTHKAWRRLGYTIRSRFLSPRGGRSRWSPTEGTSWSAQLRPLLAGGVQLLYSRRQWQLVRAYLRAQRLSRWMEKPQ